MTAPSSSIVGRDPELRAIQDFIARSAVGPCALVLQGSAGIGKTTLWQAGVAEARDRGSSALVARAAESEARMSYAAIGDLLTEVPEAVHAGLPGPLRSALDRALLRADPHGGAPDPRAVSMAVGRVLRSLAMDAPVVIAIDDVQWLDRPSARVLAFVLRRLSNERVGVLVSLRLGAGSAGDPVAIDRAIPDTTHLSVGPLSVGALGRIVRTKTSQPLSRPYVVRLHETTAGNPLFAIEVARAAVAEESPGGARDRWPVSGDLQRVLTGRLAKLPSAARRPLLAIAALSQPTWEVVTTLAGASGPSLAALQRAESAGVIERSDGRVRFTHPLLASTVYRAATDRERRSLHLELAGQVGDPEERARHLALGTEPPDEAVAMALDGAARHARIRGAPDAAADLAELASAMTSPADVSAVRQRRLAAAEYLFDAGDGPRARRLLGETIASSAPGLERAEMSYRLASMSWMNLIDGVRAPAEAALDDAGDDQRLLGGIHNALAWVAFYRADLDAAARHARLSADQAADTDVDPAVRADALATLEFIEFLRGRPDPALMAEAIRLQDVAMTDASWTEAAVYTTPRSIHALELMWAGRLAESRALLERELAIYEQHAMYTVRQEVLCYLAELECRAGRWSLASDYASEAMDTVIESGQTATQSHVVLFNQAWPAALLGDVDAARTLAARGVELAEANDDAFNAAWNHAVLGFLALSASDFERARQHLEPAAAWLVQLRSVEPGVIPCVPDLVEALVGLGRFEEADGVLTAFEALTAGRDRPWAAGAAARVRALLVAAGGDLAAAGELAERSIAHLHEAGQPFETGRSWLVWGQIRRRAKQKRPARDCLERARDLFVELGARQWADRAEAELHRIGGRPPTPFELTETEASIAALVGRGLTNREAADALFLSPATVQANLKRIYQKLDVRSRTELAAKLGRPAAG